MHSGVKLSFLGRRLYASNSCGAIAQRVVSKERDRKESAPGVSESEST
ncbi:hypothetical protein [Aetokthonos hydrillicola]|nr:hypothetical protein [Aetokthonos hydrillicola]